MNKHFVILALTAMMTAFAVRAEGDDAGMRENPEFEMADTFAVNAADRHYRAYDFIKSADNRIMMNGADWSAASAALAYSEEDMFTVLHIGDSHVQADFATGCVRDLFGEDYISAGRGLIVPLKLAGTNQPVDYTISSESKFDCNKLLKFPLHGGPMGFTGVALTPQTREFDFNIRAAQPYEKIKVYYSGGAMFVDKVADESEPLVFAHHSGQNCLEINLPMPCSDVTLGLHSLGSVDIYGFELVSDIVGVLYHAIGNNGATFDNYNDINDFGKSVSALNPSLIIVSLGTNEAFGRFDRESMYRSVSTFVDDIRRHNPSSTILLVTPAECQRRSSYRRKGSRRRRYGAYKVNENIALARNVILDYGRKNNIAVYDWYDIAGGAGSSAGWIADGLLSKDRVHYTRKGYEVQGELLYDALINTLCQTR